MQASPTFIPRAVAALAGAALLWAVLAAAHAPSALAALLLCAILLEWFAGDVLRVGGRVIGPSLTVVVASFVLYGTPAGVLAGFARGGARLLSSRGLGLADGVYILGASVFGPLIGGVAATVASAYGAPALVSVGTYALLAYCVEVLAPAAIMRRTGPPSLALSGDGVAGWAIFAYAALCALGYLLARDIGSGQWAALLYFGVPLIVLRLSYSALRTRSERYLAALEEENVEFFNRIGQLDRVNGDLIEALAFAIDYRDGIDSGRSRRVAQTSLAIGTALGLSAVDLELLRRGALLHDVGLLAMPGQRTPRHIEIGARLVSRWRDYRQIAEIVEQHCELLDGSGYPYGLRGNEISRLAQVVGVATRYVELTIVRPHGGGLTHDEAVAEIASMAPEKYDAAIVDALRAATAPASAEVLPLVRRR